MCPGLRLTEVRRTETGLGGLDHAVNHDDCGSLAPLTRQVSFAHPGPDQVLVAAHRSRRRSRRCWRARQGPAPQAGRLITRQRSFRMRHRRAASCLSGIRATQPGHRARATRTIRAPAPACAAPRTQPPAVRRRAHQQGNAGSGVAGQEGSRCDASHPPLIGRPSPAVITSRPWRWRMPGHHGLLQKTNIREANDG